MVPFFGIKIFGFSIPKTSQILALTQIRYGERGSDHRDAAGPAGPAGVPGSGPDSGALRGHRSQGTGPRSGE